MKTIVIAKSRYGTSEQYAKALAKACGGDYSDKLSERIVEYDTIVYGAGLYASGINKVKLLNHFDDQLLKKNLIVFSVGISDPKGSVNQKNIASRLEEDLPELAGHLKLFHLRGNLEYSKLSRLHKVMLNTLIRTIKKQEPQSLNKEQKEFLKTHNKDTFFYDEKQLEPILWYIKSLEA